MKWLPVFDIKRALWPDGPPRIRDVIEAQLTPPPPRPQPAAGAAPQESAPVQLLLLLR